MGTNTTVPPQHRSLGGSPVFAIGARGFSLSASFALNVLVARTLPVDEAGSFFVAFAFVTLAATVARFGIDNLAMRNLAGDSNAPLSFRTYQSTLFATSLFAVPFAALVVLILHSVSQSAFDLRTLLSITLALPGLALSVLNGALLRASGRVATGVIVELGAVPGMSCVALVFAGRSVGQAADVALIYAAAATIAAVVSTFATWSRGGAAEPWRLLRSNAVQLWHYMATSVLFLAVTWAPVLILGIVATTREVAEFTIANRLVGFLLLVPALQTAYLAPRFAFHHREGQPAIVGHLARRATVISLSVGIPVLALFELAPSLPLQIFDGDFAEASATPLRILSLGALFVLASGQVNALLLTCGRERTAFRLNSYMLGGTIAGSFLVGHAYGAVGVAAVSASALATYAVVATLTLARTERITASIFGART